MHCWLNDKEQVNSLKCLGAGMRTLMASGMGKNFGNYRGFSLFLGWKQCFWPTDTVSIDISIWTLFTVFLIAC